MTDFYPMHFFASVCRKLRPVRHAAGERGLNNKADKQHPHKAHRNGEPLLCAVKKTKHLVEIGRKNQTTLKGYISVHIPFETTFLFALI